MTVLAMPTHGRWAWDDRGDGRAVRVSTHADVGLLVVSLWRDNVCVGTVRLAPAEAAAVAAALTDGLAELADRPAPGPVPAADRLHAAEERLPAGRGPPPPPRPPGCTRWRSGSRGWRHPARPPGAGPQRPSPPGRPEPRAADPPA